jgi:hypothetical protein
MTAPTYGEINGARSSRTVMGGEHVRSKLNTTERLVVTYLDRDGRGYIEIYEYSLASGKGRLVDSREFTAEGFDKKD